MERILGVNLSGWFIPEPWVTPSLYAATGASNAAELQEAMGTAAYNERMRRHYETFVSEDDFRRMAQIGLNAVRLPVPRYAFGSQESDASYISVVDYIDRAIEWAAKYDIRVLLDLATVPGGQGDSNDSPTTPEAVAEWHSSTNGRHVALDVLERLAERYGEAESLLGIELLDTPQMSVRKSLFTMTDGIPAHYLRNFYRDAYELVRSYMPEDKIVVFSSSGHPSEWKHSMRGAKYKNVYMDLHLYHYRDEHALDITSPRGLFRVTSASLKKRFRLGSPCWWANGRARRSLPTRRLRPRAAMPTSACLSPISWLRLRRLQVGSSKRGRPRSALQHGTPARRSVHSSAA